MQHRIMYLRDSNGQPVGCVAIRVSQSQRLATYQLSVLNPADRFNRAVARQLALGRLVEAPFTVRLPSLPSMHDITEAVFTDIESDRQTPSRARRAARQWLRNNIYTPEMEF